MLKTLAENHKINWKRHKKKKKKSTSAYNNAKKKKKTAGYSPHFRLCCRGSRLSIAKIFETTSNIHNSKSLSSYELEVHL